MNESKANIIVKQDGSVWAIGYNYWGNLGNGTSGGNLTTWTKLSITNVKQVVYNNSATIILKNDGTLWAAGSNGDGTTGQNTNTGSVLTFTRIGTDTNWSSVAIGYSHVLAIKTDGTLWGWGDNNLYAMGLPLSQRYLVPTKVGTLTDWKQIVCGQSCSYAIKNDGTLWAIGSGASGQLGNGSTSNLTTWTKVSSASWNKIDISYNNTAVGIQSNGTLWDTGSNSNMIVPTTHNSFAQSVNKDTNWLDIKLGDWSAIGLKTDGTIWTWGTNTSGQLGNGSSSSYSTPTKVGTDTDWTQILSTTTSNYALKTNGILFSAGSNTYYQLGNGNNSDSNVFVKTISNINLMNDGQTKLNTSFNYSETTTNDFTTGTLTNVLATNDELDLAHGTSTNAISTAITNGGYYSGAASKSYNVTIGAKDIVVDRLYAVGVTYTSNTYTVTLSGNGVNASTSVSCSSGTGYAWSSTVITPVILQAGKTYTISMSGGTYRPYINNSSLTFDSRIASNTYTATTTGMCSFGIATFVTSGNRVLPDIDISSISPKNLNCPIVWNANVPTNTTLAIQTSVDNGTSWQTCTSGSAIPNLAQGTTTIKVKELLTTTDTSVTPALYDLTITGLEQTSQTYNISGSDSFNFNDNYTIVKILNIENNDSFSFSDTSTIGLLMNIGNTDTFVFNDSPATVVVGTCYILNGVDSLSFNDSLYINKTLVLNASDNQVFNDYNLLQFNLNYIENSQSDFNKGTLTNVVANANNTLTLNKPYTHTTILDNFGTFKPYTFSFDTSGSMKIAGYFGYDDKYCIDGSGYKFTGLEYASTTIFIPSNAINATIQFEYVLSIAQDTSNNHYPTGLNFYVDGYLQQTFTSTDGVSWILSPKVSLTPGSHNIRFNPTNTPVTLTAQNCVFSYGLDVDNISIEYDVPSTTYATSGSRIITIPVDNDLVKNSINWSANIPVNTTLTIKASTNGTDYTTLTNGQSISGINGASSLYLQELFTTSDTSITPTLYSLNFSAYNYNAQLINNTDAFSFSDNASITKSLNISGTDSFSFNDSATIASVFKINNTDSFSFSDSVSIKATLIASNTDTFSFDDSSIITKTLNKSATDTFSFGITDSITSALNINATDNFSVDDSNTIKMLFKLNGTDTFSFDDNGVMGASNGNIGNIDTFSFDDSSIIIKALNTSATDTFSFEDSGTAKLVFNINASDSFSFEDTNSIKKISNIGNTDTLSFIDTQPIPKFALHYVDNTTKQLVKGTIHTNVTEDFTDTNYNITYSSFNNGFKRAANIGYGSSYGLTWDRAATLAPSVSFNLPTIPSDAKNIFIGFKSYANGLYGSSYMYANLRGNVQPNLYNHDWTTSVYSFPYTGSSLYFSVVVSNNVNQGNVYIDNITLDYDIQNVYIPIVNTIQLPLNGVQNISTSYISWNQTTPNGTSVVMEASLDNTNWTTISSGSPISILTNGLYVGNKILYIRESLNSDGTNTPTVSNLKVDIYNTQTISTSTIVSYAVKNIVAQEVAGSYGVKGTTYVAVGCNGGYSIHRTVSTQSDGNYSIHRKITVPTAFTYNVKRKVISTTNGNYAIHKKLTKTTNGKYAVHTTLTKTTNGNYSIHRKITIPTMFSYNVKRLVQTTTKGNYAIHTTLSKNTNGNYAIHTTLTQDVNGNYSTKSTSTITSSTSGYYNVRRTTTITSDGSYYVNSVDPMNGILVVGRIDGHPFELTGILNEGTTLNGTLDSTITLTGALDNNITLSGILNIDETL